MEVMSILIGLIFWPTALIIWLIYCQRRKVAGLRRLTGIVSLIGLPLLGAFSLGRYMFLDEPLYAAYGDGDTTKVRSLLALGADPNVDFKGNVLLKQAAASGDVSMVRLLLSYGARPNQRDREGATPLKAATLNGYADVAKLLRKAGAKE